MTNEKTPDMLGNNAVSRDNANIEAPPPANTTHLEATQSNISNTLEKPEHIPNLNHVEALNLPDAAALEKRIVRRLDIDHAATTVDSLHVQSSQPSQHRPSSSQHVQRRPEPS